MGINWNSVVGGNQLGVLVNNCYISFLVFSTNTWLLKNSFFSLSLLFHSSHAIPSSIQHPLITDLNDRSVRIQIKDQIDRMKRKKLTDEYEYSGSDEEGGSLDPPTVKKQGGMFVV